MPTVKCTLSGFEEVEITYPDKWLMAHITKVHQASLLLQEDYSPFMEQACKAIALCDEIKGVEFDNVDELPLHYFNLFSWFVDTVWVKYLQATTIPNES